MSFKKVSVISVVFALIVFFAPRYALEKKPSGKRLMQWFEPSVSR